MISYIVDRLACSASSRPLSASRLARRSLSYSALSLSSCQVPHAHLAMLIPADNAKLCVYDKPVSVTTPSVVRKAHGVVNCKRALLGHELDPRLLSREEEVIVSTWNRIGCL
jgi:hypothetical protein